MREGIEIHSRLLKAPLLVLESRAFWEHVVPGESAPTADRAFEEGWFGRKSHATVKILLSTFALRFGIPIQPMSVQRIGDQARFKIIVHEPIQLVDTGDRDADIEAGVRRINAFIEDRVRARPAEWFWVHTRWPNEVYR